MAMVDYLKNQNMFHHRYIYQVVSKVMENLQHATSLASISLLDGAHITVCGDVHGHLSGLFALGAGQGFIGRWMVKSGLEELPSEYSQPKVSPYRLAAHLTSAFAIYCGLFWTALSVVMPEHQLSHWLGFGEQLKVKRLVLPVSFIVGITAISGAFVAGNDAGRAFNTFPKMGDTWIPDGIFEMKPLIRNFFENTATVQLDHRLLATTTLLAIGTMWWFTRKLDIHPAVKALIGSTVGMTAVQVTLGVSTLLSYVPVSLGSAHQAGALTLLTLIHAIKLSSPPKLRPVLWRISVGRRRDIARTDGEKSTGCLVVFATVAAVAVVGPLLGLMSVSHARCFLSFLHWNRER
ncbi:unnamed protein product [Brassica napus]|uniref:(rape) hypothetical protein n=1 Tax=Brassica napus TaxID=3708 RepID=A0A817BJC4_BRANA|nr:unnamed protein product [Brassica napus]